ncbi:MAG: isoleucine--tRNA ligase [Candidatus Aminicenantes bacterium]|nr:isoleucine--tRNA ligase [Candidatus Aminicenantes bacterium]
MSQENKPNWKNTLNLPKTAFPMKAQLNQKEPQILKKWQDINIYEKILKKRESKPLYILHDGPPYANGNIHLGHALNKILKDFVIKSKSMEGYQAPYVPGWDCHGLPIEHKVDQQLGSMKAEMKVLQIREKCKAYALKYLKIQKDEFIRLGVFGDWDNPYTTLDYSYESTVIDYFKSFVKNKNVYRKKRPVYWCTSCMTALAEAEVEYADHASSSIYVKFLLKEFPDILKEYKGKDVFVMIWTTTPWTIPANLAIAVHPQFDYSLFEMNGEYYIAASRLIPVLGELLKSPTKKIKEFKGIDLKGLNIRHPLFDRDSLLITTDYVILDQGTGCVHTAPGHGEEDYRAGLEYNLDIYSPVDPAGLFDQTAGKYEGKNIFEANTEIIQDLKEKNRLLYEDKIQHSYPHCWRCKNPIIFRATEQWFISIDTSELRAKALKEIKKVKWLPEWGEDRIFKMVESRPDWCISRQRDWGVPIPVFFCKKCKEPLLSLEVINRVEKLFKTQGSNCWYELDETEFIPEGTKCSKCNNDLFEKGLDIVDVWFESGSSFGILDRYPMHQFPSDMYLEGGDQYRGWFHSSLLVSTSAKGISPYKTVITHGFTLDFEGRAMSKSLGNVIEPQGIIKEKGAEILRLWVAMINYREDVKLGDELLIKITESYRNIRNRWRFMLGVLSDFIPEKHYMGDEKLGEVDRYILFKLQRVKKKIIEAYKNYEYHIVFHTISNFFTIDLSSFYLNIMKDNLYCNARDSAERRAAQSTIFKILLESLILMAPIMSFTTEEAWEFLPAFKGKEVSIHLHEFPEIEEHYFKMVDEKKWDQLSGMRDDIFKKIEDARNRKTIGDTLEAEVTLELTAEMFSLVSDNLDLFKEILAVSKINIFQKDSQQIFIHKSKGKKCPRCWNWFGQEATSGTSNDLCFRCNQVVKELKIESES